MSDKISNPEDCQPENEVEFLCYGMDKDGHLLRLMVDGKQKWVRVRFPDIEHMYRAQELVKSGLINFDKKS